VLLPAAALACVVGLSGCGGAKSTGCGRCPAELAQIRADTFASVAARIYRQEVQGAANSAAFAHIAGLRRLRRGIDSGDLALARRALASQSVVRHAVRARVVDGARVLVDVGLRFVIAGSPHPLTTLGGRPLGQLEVSIQDVSGFVKLITRLTGTEVVVRGSRAGHVATSLPAASAVALPASGPVVVGGRRYVVSSLVRPGFGGEQLHVWLLDQQ
jgi:hypothetical protein